MSLIRPWLVALVLWLGAASIGVAQDGDHSYLLCAWMNKLRALVQNGAPVEEVSALGQKLIQEAGARPAQEARLRDAVKFLVAVGGTRYRESVDFLIESGVALPLDPVEKVAMYMRRAAYCENNPGTVDKEMAEGTLKPLVLAFQVIAENTTGDEVSPVPTGHVLNAAIAEGAAEAEARFKATFERREAEREKVILQNKLIEQEEGVINEIMAAEGSAKMTKEELMKFVGTVLSDPEQQMRFRKAYEKVLTKGTDQL